MSNALPAAAAAGAKAEKTPAPIIEPSPMTTASRVPTLRANAGIATAGTVSEGRSKSTADTRKK
jgi:hypothetical protein